MTSCRRARGRVVVGIGAAAVIALTLAACGSSGSGASASGSSGGGGGGQSVTLTYGTNGGDAALAAEKKVLAAFHAANPSITVNMQVIPFDSYDTKMTTSLRAKNGPDVFRVNHPNVQAWTQAGFLAPLDDAGIDTSAFIPGLVSVGKVDGKQYTLPMDTDARALYYNPSLMTKAGISAVPTTWDELLADVKKVKSATGAYGFAYRADSDYAMAYETVGPFMKTAGGAILAEKDGKTQAVAADDAKTVKAVQFVQSIVKAGVTPPGQATMTEDTMNQLFANDKLGFMVGGPWEKANILKDNPKLKYGTTYATAPIPAEQSGGTSASTSGGWQIGVGAASDHVDAAMKLAKFIEQPANLVSIAATGTFPPTKTGLDQSPWKSDKFYDAFKTELPNSGLPILPVPQLAQVAAAFEKGVGPVLLNSGSVKDALTSFDTQANDEVLR